MSIEITYDHGKIAILNSINNRYESVNLTDLEELIIEKIYTFFRKKSIDMQKIHLERRTSNYLSVISGENNDFFRLKIGVRSFWFSIDAWLFDNDYKNLACFDSVKNKNQRHWKINLACVDDFDNYLDIIFMSYELTKDN